MAYTHAGRFGSEALTDPNGKLLKNLTVEIARWGTTEPVQLYNSSTLANVKTTPLVTSPTGLLGFWADYQPVGFVVLQDGVAVTDSPIFVTEPAEDTIDLEDIGVLVAGLINGKIDIDNVPDELLSGAVGIVSGVGAPDQNIGTNGQLYYDTESVSFYGPKTDVGWGPEATIRGAKGDTGEDGTPGNPGNPGQDGRSVLYGIGAPQAALGNAGDFYYEFQSNVPVRLWGPKSQATGWGNIGASLQGPQGVDGDQGPQGPPGTSDVMFKGVYASGTTYNAKDEVAFNGLLYIANATTTGTPPVEGGSATWAQATSRGPQGLQGNPGTAGAAGTNGSSGFSVRTGINSPSNASGVDGDSYIDTLNLIYYGPKAGGVWPSPGKTMIGTKGDKGDTGVAGSIPLQMLLLGTFSRINLSYDTDGKHTGASVQWPDGSSGTYTVTSYAPGDTDTIDSFTITHAPSGAIVTQGAATRNSNGDETYRPPRSISYPGGIAPVYQPSTFASVNAGGYLIYNGSSYPPRPAGLVNGNARWKGPVAPPEMQSLDDFIQMDV